MFRSHSASTRFQQPAMSPLGKVALVLAKWLPRGYWPLLRFAAERDPALRDLAVPIGDMPAFALRADMRESVYAPILRYGCIPHQRGQDRLYRRILRRGELVLDIGANIGYTALVFADAVGPSGGVYAFEPSERIYALLERSMRPHAHIHALRLAVGDETGSLPFFESSFSNLSSVIPIAGVVQKIVPSVSIDEFCKQVGVPAFIKIDVEGFEWAVLSGARETLRGERPPMLSFEALDRPSLERCSVQIERCAPNRFSIHRILHSGALAASHSPIGTDDYLALPDWAGSRVR
jgi:FkbM family methyltransferase